jgi:hypothetical protein
MGKKAQETAISNKQAASAAGVVCLDAGVVCLDVWSFHLWIAWAASLKARGPSRSRRLNPKGIIKGKMAIASL